MPADANKQVHAEASSTFVLQLSHEVIQRITSELYLNGPTLNNKIIEGIAIFS
jgi:hypothetical protein